MKSSFLLALASLFLALATFGGNSAYGETAGVIINSAQVQGKFCTGGDDWNFNDPNCHPGVIQPGGMGGMEGSAAFGAPVATPSTLPEYCRVDGNDWNFGDSTCHPSLAQQGRAAFGAPVQTAPILPAYCLPGGFGDWNYQDANCPR